MEEERETLADASEKDVQRLLDRVRGKSSKKDSSSAPNSSAKRCIWDSSRAAATASVCGAPAAVAQSHQEILLAREKNAAEKGKIEAPEDDIDWEVGDGNFQCLKNGLTIEVEKDVGGKKKITRRANAKDKEFAELVHKLRLLCLLARGRLVDAACDDTLLKGLVYSLVPARFTSSIEPEKTTVSTLTSLVRWLNSVMQIAVGSVSGPLSELSKVLSRQFGSEEEIAAITVAMFRALTFKTRYVCVLDVASIKPDTESMLASENWEENVADSRTKAGRLFSDFRPGGSPDVWTSKRETEDLTTSPASTSTRVLSNDGPEPSKPQSTSKKRNHTPTSKPAVSNTDETTPATQQKRKRRGDEEFELELARAMAATSAAVVSTPQPASKVVQPKPPPPVVWSRKKGPLLHWAEVFCGDDSSGRWIHVDAARNLVDDVEKIEASSKQPVRYVVAFAGSGAKDVTRRYTTSWSKIQALRVDEGWWSACLSPLRLLESNAYDSHRTSNEERNTREDMELDVKSFTEPLPTNQQAYRNHHLYVMERWLTRYQVLHPKGPILGTCGGKPVYPRTCVQDLHTKERWLREGFAVREGEEPVKIIKSRNLARKVEGAPDEPSLVLLFGKWQTDPWQPPPAVDGIVPKNERGHVDVWSEKCIPPGTVHLALPRVTPVVQMLGIDFAPAMVGFEIRQGRSVPVFQGVVVCDEFKDAILQVYRAEEERREAQLREKTEAQAALRWRQLLRSMVTRERLRAAYEDKGVSSSVPEAEEEKARAAADHSSAAASDDRAARRRPAKADDENHVHSFPDEWQSYDEEACVRIKRCGCGFELRVEEM
ncbi:DNA repair protein RAD4 [Selaginella moellendorffii]|nr:DNA repair protein RAD4 [Selaginella moellendorffii]|eukprot:XP_024536390.1 DNA repair protein RAD4 [Selaginella moellendorffii]